MAVGLRPKILSWFVLACLLVLIAALYVTQVGKWELQLVLLQAGTCYVGDGCYVGGT